MPYPNYMSGQVLNPKNIAGSCRMSDREIKGKKVYMVFCQFRDPETRELKWLLQSVRFGIELWQPAEVKAICEKEGWRFEPAKEAQRKYSLEDMPGEFVRRRQIVKSENGSSIFIKTGSNPDYPIAQGKEIEKRGLEDYEYLLHHLHTEGEEIEETHHCYLADHLGNLFELAHLEKDGETYHIVKGLEPTQDIVWADEEAKEKGIEPKELRAGMSFEEKANIW